MCFQRLTNENNDYLLQQNSWDSREGVRGFECRQNFNILEVSSFTIKAFFVKTSEYKSNNDLNNTLLKFSLRNLSLIQFLIKISKICKAFLIF